MLGQHSQPAEMQLAAGRSTDYGRLPLDPRAALAWAWRANRPLTLLGMLMLLALGASLVGLVVDPRAIAGAPAWLKPFKFALSIVLYSFTLLWMLRFVQGRRFLVRLVSVVSLLAFLVEIAVIATQALRGTTSHFNVGTQLDAALFSIMGMFVVLIWAMNLVAAVLLLLQRLPDPAFAWALRLGLLIALLGTAVGFLMTRPTPEQGAAMAAGARPAVIGAHSVGVADGGPGLPIVGWSTTGGDLRVGHFVGMHALQLMPIVGWLLARRRARRLGDARRLALTWIAGLGYLGLTALVVWQALRGQPLLAPDGLTLAALAGLIGAVALAAGAALTLGRRVQPGS